MPKKPPDVVSINLRLPGAMHRTLVQKAKRNGVSLNTQIINQLGGPPPTPEMMAIIKETAKEAAHVATTTTSQTTVFSIPGLAEGLAEALMKRVELIPTKSDEKK